MIGGMSGGGGSGKAKVDGQGNIKLGKNVSKTKQTKANTTVLGSDSLTEGFKIGSIKDLSRDNGTFNQADQLWEPFQGNTITDAKNTIPNTGYDWTEYSPDGDAPALTLNTALAGDNTNYIQVVGNTNLERQGIQLAADKMTANGGLVSGEYYLIQFLIRATGSAKNGFCFSFGGQTYPVIGDLHYSGNTNAQVDELPHVNNLCTKVVNCRDAAQPLIIYQRLDSNGNQPWKIGPIMVAKFKDLTGTPTGTYSGTGALFSYVTDIYGNSILARKFDKKATLSEVARYNFEEVSGENYNANETLIFEDPGSTSNTQEYKIESVTTISVEGDSDYNSNSFQDSFFLGSNSFKSLSGSIGYTGIGQDNLGGSNNLSADKAVQGYTRATTIGQEAGGNWSSNSILVKYTSDSGLALYDWSHNNVIYVEPDTSSNVKISWDNMYSTEFYMKTTAIGSRAMKNVIPVDQGAPVSPEIQDLHSTIETNDSTKSLIGTRRDCGYNTAVGAEALHGGRDTLNASIAVGYRALGGDKGAYYRNVGLGNEAWYTNNGGPLDSTSVGSIAIGYKAARFCREARGFVAIGYFALDGGYSAHYATAIGERALESCYTGINNTAIGNRSSAQLVSGHNNISIGYRSGYSLQAGSGNTFLGTDICNHGIGQTGNLLTGDNNTAIGYRAGVNLKSAASYNTIIGGLAQNDNVTGSYNVLIGSDVMLDQGSGDNQINIGMDNTLGVQMLCKRILLTYSHDTPNTCINHTGLKIPAHSIIKSVTAKVNSINDTLATYKVNIFLATNSSLNRDIAPTTTGITNPEILGAGATNTYQQNSTIAMAGTASDIDVGSGATVKTVYYNEPRDTIVGSADVYVVVCNAVDNGTGDEDSCRIELTIEYIGKD